MNLDKDIINHIMVFDIFGRFISVVFILSIPANIYGFADKGYLAGEIIKWTYSFGFYFISQLCSELLMVAFDIVVVFCCILAFQLSMLLKIPVYTIMIVSSIVFALIALILFGVMGENRVLFHISNICKIVLIFLCVTIPET